MRSSEGGTNPLIGRTFCRQLVLSASRMMFVQVLILQCGPGALSKADGASRTQALLGSSRASGCLTDGLNIQLSLPVCSDPQNDKRSWHLLKKQELWEDEGSLVSAVVSSNQKKAATGRL